MVKTDTELTKTIERLLEAGSAALDAESSPSGVDRDKVLPASEAGRCVRWLWYARNRADEAAEQKWGFARRGRYVEKYIVDAFRAANRPLLYAGEEQVFVVAKDHHQSATPDGIFWGEILDKFHGVEIKSKDPRTNVSRLPNPNHVLQLQVAMAIKEQPDDEMDADSGVLIYVDASNFDDRLVFEVPHDPDVLDKLEPRALKMLRARSDTNLEREGQLSGDCKYCPFTEICGVEVAAPQRARANRGSNLHAAVETMLVVKAEEAEIKRRRDEASTAIRAELEKRGKSKLVVGDVEVTLSTVKGRSSLDKKAAAAAGIDLSLYEKIGAPSTRLNVERMNS